MQSSKDMIYYTGLPSVCVFKHILELVVQNNPQLTKSADLKSHTAEEQLFMVLVRLRTGIATKEISRTFGISMATFSRVFSSWILALERVLINITSFPALQEVQQNMSSPFEAVTEHTANFRHN
ncbi:hypothetical protein HPB48_020467 [Haemaphysalis longicornis]|uniref:Transposase Helix-turn-helix domain-containing protein n=1 Tax=Haemaphysalis longicornis TaxID=44386 RepID=A0A9J6G8C3_HAELO|nr:hypothetical protein HPB48_020467 [Haemaphysalis longicornis]